jgi:flagellar export protein FliJ
MPPFVFRADAALRLRQTQDDAAQQALSRALSDVAASEARRDDVTHRLQDARATALDALHEMANAAAARQWHRNWIVRLERDLQTSRAEIDERRRAALAARARAVQARRDLRTLEKLKERAWKHYQQAARRDEQKVLNELGTLQHAARAARRSDDD